MSDTKCAPYPWMQDKYGNVKDANGDTVKLIGFALSCGYTPKDDSCYVNTKIAIAAPELLDALEFLLDSLGALANKSELHGWMEEEDQEKIWKAIAKAKGE